MEVILKEDVPTLGSRGDVIKVADGYGRNYLLPRKLAIEATRSNRAVIEQMKQASLRRAARDKADAEAQAKLFESVTLSFTRKAGEKDQLFVELRRELRRLRHAVHHVDLRARGLCVGERARSAGHAEHVAVSSDSDAIFRQRDRLVHFRHVGHADRASRSQDDFERAGEDCAQSEARDRLLVAAAHVHHRHRVAADVSHLSFRQSR